MNHLLSVPCMLIMHCYFGSICTASHSPQTSHTHTHTHTRLWENPSNRTCRLRRIGSFFSHTIFIFYLFTMRIGCVKMWTVRDDMSSLWSYLRSWGWVIISILRSLSFRISWYFLLIDLMIASWFELDILDLHFKIIIKVAYYNNNVYLSSSFSRKCSGYFPGQGYVWIWQLGTCFIIIIIYSIMCQNVSDHGASQTCSYHGGTDGRRRGNSF